MTQPPRVGNLLKAVSSWRIRVGARQMKDEPSTGPLRQGGRTVARFGAALGLFLALLAAGVLIIRARAPTSPTPAPVSELDEIADSMAAGNAEPDPKSEEYVESSRGKAVDAIGPGTVVDTDQPVYLIKISGDFVGEMASVPPGEDLPTGSYLYVVVDQASLRVNDWAIGNQDVDLSTLGKPSPLPNS